MILIMRNSPSLSRGFTLMEILIALSIFAIVGVMIAFILQQLITTRQIFSEKSTVLSERALFRTILQRQLLQCLPFATKNNQHNMLNMISTFKGNSTQISCDIATMGLASQKKFLDLNLNRTIATMNFNLMADHIIETLKFKENEQSLQQILLSNVYQWSLQYFDGSAWQNSWPNQNTTSTSTSLLLPTALKISIQFQNGLNWPIYLNLSS